jgi:hypothetical protein
MKKFWYIWCKALGEKAHSNNATSDAVALIRTGIVLIYIVTNLLISINIIRKW